MGKVSQGAHLWEILSTPPLIVCHALNGQGSAAVIFATIIVAVAVSLSTASRLIAKLLPCAVVFREIHLPSGTSNSNFRGRELLGWPRSGSWHRNLPRWVSVV